MTSSISTTPPHHTTLATTPEPNLCLLPPQASRYEEGLCSTLVKRALLPAVLYPQRVQTALRIEFVALPGGYTHAADPALESLIGPYLGLAPRTLINDGMHLAHLTGRRYGQALLTALNLADRTTEHSYCLLDRILNESPTIRGV